MNRMKTLVLTALCCAFWSTGAWADESCDYPSLEGEEITFRPSYPGGEKYGYSSWYSKPDVVSGKLAYAPYVGRKGKVLEEVLTDQYGITKFKPVVLENCERVYANLSDGKLPHGAYTALDYDLGKLLIGKQIWIDQTAVARPTVLVTEHEATSYPLTNIEPVTVTDIYLSTIGHAFGAAPFFLKVRKASGEEGYLNFNTKYFHVKYPIAGDTPEEVAQAIRAQSIVLGMTPEQVTLSWGKPKDVNTSVGSWGVREQWVYGRRYVYLENGKVTSFQF